MPSRRRLDRSAISTAQKGSALVLPASSMLDLPERAVQFGTGAFLRGFVEYFIDAANSAGLFDGRIVAIGSTGSGRDDVVNRQEGLYTLVTEGIENGRPVRELRVIASLSRALSANAEWDEVLQLARNPEIAMVFSNTTEVGIALDPDDELAEPPRSFPGKLTAFLYERARTFGYSAESGLHIVPCELIERNGDKLREIVTELAGRWNLGGAFSRWLGSNAVFCNTLVDRIVPGTPSLERRRELETMLGYRDDLITVCEPYRLFAIECPSGDSALQFPDVDPRIIVTRDIEPYRLRKVRLLNGAHSLLAPIALQCGANTVFEAISDDIIGAYLRRTMYDELVAALDAPNAATFAREVVERFGNPYLAHSLFDITLHGTTKMRVRVIPSIVDFARKEGRVPELIAFGFAAFILFLRGDLQHLRRSAGLPVPADEHGALIRELWAREGPDRSPHSIARAVCADESLWGLRLGSIAGFEDAVASHLARMQEIGVRGALSQLLFRGAHLTDHASARAPH